MTVTVLETLKSQTGRSWPGIQAAQEASRAKMLLLSSVIGDDLIPHGDTGLVVFGSLARQEFTENSDLDWTLLVDGRADSDHLQVAHQIRDLARQAGFPDPGPTGTFGGPCFSHDVVHDIGGDDDTNRNMTRRLLLLLESAPVIVGDSQAVRKRVIDAILMRYVLEDASYLDPSAGVKIPRFLLNDVVRFWRTMAVDYAHKYRERSASKWALRNIKLRMSRKLLFVSGLYMCLSWGLRDSTIVPGTKSWRQDLVDHLSRFADTSPLEILAEFVAAYSPASASPIFDAYDEFLQLLSDTDKRMHIEKLEPEFAHRDTEFRKARDGSDRFDEALTNILFDQNNDIGKLVRKYGVF